MSVAVIEVNVSMGAVLWASTVEQTIGILRDKQRPPQVALAMVELVAYACSLM
jgi:hypothetical protein